MEYVLGLQKSYQLSLLKNYLASEISVRDPFRPLISQTPKRPIIFFSVLQDITLRVMAVYRGVSGFLPPPLIPKKLRPAIGNVLPKGSVDLEAYGLPPHLALRVGAHVGPVFEAYDAVMKANNYFGTHVTRTARVEPATPAGEVYVTEPFAARLALERGINLVCEYVGRMPAAKGYGLMRMYVLKRKA